MAQIQAGQWFFLGGRRKEKTCNGWLCWPLKGRRRIRMGWIWGRTATRASLLPFKVPARDSVWARGLHFYYPLTLVDAFAELQFFVLYHFSITTSYTVNTSIPSYPHSGLFSTGKAVPLWANLIPVFLIAPPGSLAEDFICSCRVPMSPQRLCRRPLIYRLYLLLLNWRPDFYIIVNQS